MDDAKKSIEALEKLAQQIKITQFAFDTAHLIVDALGNIPVIAPFMAAAGYVLSFLELFIPSDTEILLEALQ